jgi:hypothetical protein
MGPPETLSKKRSNEYMKRSNYINSYVACFLSDSSTGSLLGIMEVGVDFSLDCGRLTDDDDAFITGFVGDLVRLRQSRFAPTEKR